MVFSMPASAEMVLNCSSFGDFTGSFLVVLNLARSTKTFSVVRCKMASLDLKNKFEKRVRHERNESSSQTAAARAQPGTH